MFHFVLVLWIFESFLVPTLDHCCHIFPELTRYQLITMKRPLHFRFCSDSFHFLKWLGFSELPVSHHFLPSVFVYSEVKESANLWRASPTGGVVKPDLLCRSQWQASRWFQVHSAVPGSHARDTAGWYHAVHNSQRNKAREVNAAGPAAAQVSAGWAACHMSVQCHCHLCLESAMLGTVKHKVRVWSLSGELIGKVIVTLEKWLQQPPNAVLLKET